VKAATHKLLDAERRDQSELKKLRKELKPFADTTLWALLVDIMLLETDKHIHALLRPHDRTIASRRRGSQRCRPENH
jgi:hypothetical protein